MYLAKAGIGECRNRRTDYREPELPVTGSGLGCGLKSWIKVDWARSLALMSLALAAIA